MHFMRVNVMFYEAVNMTHDVIRTANPFPYTVKPVLKTTCIERPPALRDKKTITKT